MGELVSISFSGRPGFPRPRHAQAVVRAGHGCVGDHLAGRSQKRHLNIMDEERMEELLAEGYPAFPGEMGETLVIRGVGLDTLPVGTRIRIGATVIAETTVLREPCDKLTRLDWRMPAGGVDRVGMMARVLAGGEIRVGDPVEIVEAPTEVQGELQLAL